MLEKVTQCLYHPLRPFFGDQVRHAYFSSLEGKIFYIVRLENFHFQRFSFLWSSAVLEKVTQCLYHPLRPFFGDQVRRAYTLYHGLVI